MNTLKKKLFRTFTTPKGKILPSTYQEVEYIETYGLAYINTGVTSSNNTKIELECCAIPNLTPSSQHSRVILSAGASSSAMIAISLNPVNNAPTAMFGSTWNYSTSTVNMYNKMKITLQQGSVSVEQNGTTVTDTFTEQNITSGTIYIMGLSYSTSLTPTGRVYGCKIYDGNTLVRDFMACYRKTDKELGFYEFVSSTFFKNAGVGSFNAKYLDLPAEYKQVEYIDSSQEQAINTNIKFGNRYRIDMNVLPLTPSNGTVQGFFGAYDGSNNTYLGKGNANTWRIYYAHGPGSNQKYFENTEAQYYTLKAICGDRTQVFYVNTTNETLTKNTYSNAATAYFFARHNNSTATGDVVAIPARIRMYNANIYYDGVRYRTYIPCYRVSDNVAGLYELNNGVFYSSITGTELIKGVDK